MGEGLVGGGVDRDSEAATIFHVDLGDSPNRADRGGKQAAREG